MFVTTCRISPSLSLSLPLFRFDTIKSKQQRHNMYILRQDDMKTANDLKISRMTRRFDIKFNFRIKLEKSVTLCSNAQTDIFPISRLVV